MILNEFLNVIIDRRYNNYQYINSLMEDSNINEPPPQFDIHRLRQAINELDYGQDGQYYAISADFIINPSEYSHATLQSITGNINAKLFEGNSPLSGRLKQGLRFSVHYFVINMQMLETIEEFYQCSRIKVGRNQAFSQRWIIYKELISYVCISKQKLESQAQWLKKKFKRIEVYPYNNMSDIRLTILKNEGLPQYYKGTFWILGGQFPQSPSKFKQWVSDRSTIFPQSMLINDPEAYKLQRKFKLFTIIVEPQYQSIIPPLQVKCYLHDYKNSHYTCICRNERSYVCDKLCYDENYKHNRRCIYVPMAYIGKDTGPIIKQQSKQFQRKNQTGLFNERNMCYFNTIIQCISHIQPLSIYFLSRNQHRQLNYWNKDGTFGQIALQYGRFLREHYSTINEKSNMSLFSAVGRWNPAYANKNQQDSHQFLIKMLDWLKEDLNANEQKPVYREIESKNKSEEQFALETQAVHKARNDSIIQKLMEGVQKSVIKCSHCSFASPTFDYFLTIQLPMARQIKQQIPVNSRYAYYIPYRSQSQDKVRRFRITFDKDQTVMTLKQQVKACLARAYHYQFQFYKVSHETAEQVTNENLFTIFSIPESQKQVLFCVQKYRNNQGIECIPVNIIFKGEITSGTLPFCRPIYTKKSMEVQDLYVKVLDNVMKCKTSQNSFAIPSGFFAKYFETQDFPFDLVLKTESNQQLIPRKKQYTKYSFELGNELILNIRKNKDFDFSKLNNYTAVSGVNDKEIKKKIKVISPTIEECLKLYCKKEVIEDGKWECSNCKMKRQASKTLYFKELPSILILSINRFKQIYNTYSSTSQFQKNQSLIQYGPTLNMKKFTQGQQQQMYQLFGVACHLRIDDSLKDVRQMDGHYYAYIKAESGWLKFDDQDVTVASTEKVFNNKHAYILFYQKIIQS